MRIILSSFKISWIALSVFSFLTEASALKIPICLLGDNEELPTPPPAPTYREIKDDTIQRIEVNRDKDGQAVQKPVAKQEDPIHVMFRNAKKVVEFNLNFINFTLTTI